MSTPACLSHYQRDEYSQNGEDGVLERIFEILQVKKGWCVEFGAWDGKKYSNTCHLITNRAWSGVLIEANPSRFAELKKNYESRADVYCVKKFIGFDESNSLTSVLKDSPIPLDFDLLSIDIDGNDIHIWESLEDYRPKVVIIEYNPTIPNPIVFIQPRDMQVNQGSSLLALTQLGKQKGYELVAVTETNGIYVRKELFPLFNIENNGIDQLRPEVGKISYLFQLYDGTLVLEGNKKLLWSGVPIREEKLQVFPKSLRYFQTSNKMKKLMRNLWRLLYTRKII
jgi:hypothetical protein